MRGIDRDCDTQPPDSPKTGLLGGPIRPWDG